MAQSGSMEEQETSPSHTSGSSTLELPSVSDLAEHFLPPHSSESSQELYPSGDVLPSPPTAFSLPHSSCFTVGHLWYPGISSTSGFRSPSAGPAMNMSNDSITGESNPSPAAPGGCSAEGSEEANVRCYPKAGLCEPSEPDGAVLSWLYERDGAEDPSIRDSLDDFYKMFCRKQPEIKDPAYEAASRCLSQKISELGQKDGTKYLSRCLQMAQLVLNRDGCKIFPNHPPSACFSKPAEGEVLLEHRRRTPGLSEDVLQFLLKQTQAERSPDGSQEE